MFVSGHSLGGALATLAAYDIQKQLQEAGRQSVEVVCYSFGAPRTGNHAFARDYNHVVPDTWSIINDQVHMQHQPHDHALNHSGTDSTANIAVKLMIWIRSHHHTQSPYTGS